MALQFLEHVVLATLAEWDWLWSSIVEYKGQVYGCLTLIATLALAVLYFSHRLTPSRSLLLWRQKRLCFFQWKETNLKTFSPICTADFMHFGSKLRSAATKTSAAATYTDAVPWLSCYRFQPTNDNSFDQGKYLNNNGWGAYGGVVVYRALAGIHCVASPITLCWWQRKVVMTNIFL